MIREVSSGINCSDKVQFPCDICGKRGHHFDGYLKLMTTNMKKVYVRLPSGQNQDL